MSQHLGKPQISVVIPALNAASHIQIQLAALAQQETTLDFEVIVADNGSTDDTRSVLKNLAPAFPWRLRAVDAPKPGASAARNAGAAAADADILAFCDSDDVVAPNWIEVAHRATIPGFISAGTSRELLDPIDPSAPILFEAGPVGDGHQLAASGNFTITASDFWSIGGFDESLPPFGWEDVDFSLRAIDAGLEIRHVPELVIYYRQSTSLRTRLRKIYLSAWAREMVDARRHPDYAETLGSILRRGATSHREALLGPQRAPRRKHAILAADLAGRVRGLQSIRTVAERPGPVDTETDRSEPVQPIAFASNEHLAPQDRATLARIRQTITEAIEPLIPEKQTILLDVPNHLNAGDTLIRDGEEALLRHLGVEIKLTATKDYQLWKRLASVSPSTTILLHGGGNLGDLYPAHDQYRQTVLQRVPGHRVVLMPQSIHYQDKGSARAMRDALERHGNVTVLLRDYVSLEQGKSLFPNTDVQFCPDMAFWTDLPPRRTKSFLTALSRDDIEGGIVDLTSLESSGFELADWELTDAQKSRAQRERRIEHIINVRIPRRLWYIPGFRHIYSLWNNSSVQTLSALNRETVHSVFENSGLVVTNRLHAHIICCLKGIPHIAVDNSYAKLSRVFAAYSGEFTTAHFASSAESLRSLVEELVHTTQGKESDPHD